MGQVDLDYDFTLINCERMQGSGMLLLVQDLISSTTQPDLLSPNNGLEIITGYNHVRVWVREREREYVSIRNQKGEKDCALISKAQTDDGS